MPPTPFGTSTASEMSTVIWMLLGIAATVLVAWLAGALSRLPERIGTIASTAAIGAATILLAGMLAAPVMTATLPSSLPAMWISLQPSEMRVKCVVTDRQSVEMKTFLTSVNESSASGPSSRPMPLCLKPPKGVE